MGQIHYLCTDDGMVRIQAQLHPDEAARVLAAIDACAETADRADGLVSLADQGVRGDSPDRSPVEVTLCVEASSLEGTLEDGTGVSAEASRRLLCDAGILPMLEDEQGRTLDVGRRTRTIPASIHRAMRRRDQNRCRFPGCDHRRWLDGHHIKHWLDDGHTKLDNLVSLCRGHHRLMHESGFTVAQTEDEEFVFCDPHGTPVPGCGRLPLAPAAMAKLRRWIRDDGTHLSARTNDPRWDGTPPQYELIIDTLNAASLRQ